MSGVRLDLNASDLKLAPGILRQSMRALEQTHNIPFGYSILKDIADQIEAQTKPPRIPEPGWGAIVEAHSHGAKGDRLRWVRGERGWTNLDAVGRYLNWTDWDDLVDPTLIREGVQP